MDLVSFFSQTNKLPGNFIQIGFDKGTDTKTIFNAMNDGSLTKRETFIFDSFISRLGQAMDMRFSLTNPNEKVSVVKGDVTDTLTNVYDGSKIAFILINLDSFQLVLHSLLSIHPFLVRDGLIFVKHYGTSLEVTTAVDEFIATKKLSHQLFTSGEFPYIRNKVAPVEFTPTRVGKSERAPEEGIPVPVTKPLKPYKDRYKKPVIKEFVPKQVIKPGLTPIDKKVSK